MSSVPKFTQRELEELRMAEKFFRRLAAGAVQADFEPGPLAFSHDACERLLQVPALVQPAASLNNARSTNAGGHVRRRKAARPARGARFRRLALIN